MRISPDVFNTEEEMGRFFEVIKKLGPVTLADCRASIGDEPIATGELKFYVEGA